MTIELPQRPERVETDASLQAERQKTDDEIAKRGAAVDRDADDIVELARERADLVLEAERDAVDATDCATELDAAELEQRTEARAAADEALADARTAADDRLDSERAEQQRALLALLALERMETDEHLSMERARADRVVASRDDFLAMVSHDVRGILAGMAASAELLVHVDTEASGQAVARREGQRLQRLTARMNRLIGDLLDVVSMESGLLQLDATVQDATTLVAETVDTFHGAAAARGVALVAEVDGPQRARFDHGRVLQVLANLVGNALKFTAPGGTIAVGVGPVDAGVRFTVRDDGCGIAADRLTSIFERFAQAADRDRRGLGLGLYIARSIVVAHGGTIWADSKPGKGSTFHVTLPAGTD